jgi:hypothetical protein
MHIKGFAQPMAVVEILGQKRAGTPSLVRQLLRATATVALDLRPVPRRSQDARDDYLIALAESEVAIVISGDRDLLALAPAQPVMAPGDFLGQLQLKEGEFEKHPVTPAKTSRRPLISATGRGWRWRPLEPGAACAHRDR